MNTTGSREIAMAPTTILVLKRAPSCSLLRSAQRRTTERVRIKKKTSAAAVMKLETANRAILARQLPGSNGMSSDPKVKTAARSRESRMPPIARLQRCLGWSELMWRLWSFLVRAATTTPTTDPATGPTRIPSARGAVNPSIAPLASWTAKAISAGTRRSVVRVGGRSACRCERSEREIHYTVRRRAKDYARIIGGRLHNRALRRRRRGARACDVCRRPPRRRDVLRRKEEWSRRFPGRCRARREVVGARCLWARETFWRERLDIRGGGRW